ncbi:hypothetical protein GJ629_07825 [Halapricum sp. CBA1109]|uniref:hypothetical protein n=1 Tax=Halapricum sp. CBA1109 TaxID=2668068 RepID=UPI0012F710D1|nr:hypothetical protein [Halapricum sp. CBA1109]MUV89813.1 hypothetical protein [Halapricum sp. CBA1109]
MGKSPRLAALLSFLVAGLGQLYLGQVVRAGAWFGGAILFGIVAYAVVPEWWFVSLVPAVLASLDASAQARA